jgi:hypothetical protein
VIGLIATLVASLAITAGGITHRPFINGMEQDGHWVVSEYFIGMEWPCRGRNNDETCFAGLEFGFDDAEGLVTGP